MLFYNCIAPDPFCQAQLVGKRDFTLERPTR